MTDEAPDPVDRPELAAKQGDLVIDPSAIDDDSPYVAPQAPNDRPAAEAEPRRGRTWLRVVVAVVAVGFGWYAINLFQVWHTGNSDQARPVDAIIVMGAAQYDGRPSPQLQARLDQVVVLWNEGLAPLVVVTGGKQPGDRFTEAQASAMYLTEHGVAADAILEESEGHTSWDSLSNASTVLRARDVRRVLLVSDPYHSLRIRLMAEQLGFTAYVSPTRTSPVRGATAFGKELKEAAGISIGRIIGFDHLLSITG